MPVSAKPPLKLPREVELLAGPADAEEPAERVKLGPPARFVFAAVRRRKLLVAAVFALVMTMSVVVLRSLPKSYHVETRLLAQKPSAMPAAIRQSGALEDAPTRAAYEIVHRRDSLLALVKQTNLLTANAEPRQPSLRERLGIPPLGLLRPVTTKADPLTALVDRLNRSLTVTTGEGTITIGIDWDDPVQAYQIVGAALQNFIEARHLQEITAIDEMLSLLEGRAASLYEAFQAEQEEVRRERGLTAGASDMVPAARATRRADPAQLAELRSMLEAKRRAIRDVEEFRRRRLADLQTQLDEKRGVYSDTYPAVVNLEKDIEALSRQSPQVAPLQLAERQLAAEIAARERNRKAPDNDAVAGGGEARRVDRRLSPATDAQMERLRDARFKYEKMFERINQMQVERDAARAAFKYRYSVIWPAEMPKEPSKPKPPVVLGAGFVLALLLSVLAARLADLRSGLLFESWQAEEKLGLPVLAQLRRR